MNYSCYISQAVDVRASRTNTLVITFWVEVTHVEDTCATTRIVPVEFRAGDIALWLGDDALLQWLEERKSVISDLAIKAFNEALEKAKK